MHATPEARRTHVGPAAPVRAGALALVAAAALAAAACGGGPPDYDVLIRGGTVIDGTGSPRFAADVGIRDGRIALVGDAGAARAARVIDATGLIVAPGFIDGHSHAADGLADPGLSDARPLLAQGVTTAMLNPDGMGALDLAAQRDAILRDGAGVNFALFVPHGSLRQDVMGMQARPPTDDELGRMRDVVRRGMQAGALGLSTGLWYAPASFSETDEVVELAKVAAADGGVYQSHMRDEGDTSVGVFAAADELIRIAREADITAVITHIKVFGVRFHGRGRELVERVEAARAGGLRVYADLYPYDFAGGAINSLLMPREAMAGDADAYARRLADPAERARLRRAVLENLERWGGADRIRFRHYAADPSFEGRSLQEAADARGVHPADLALEIEQNGGASVISFIMHEDDVELFMRQPWVMTGSDGGLVAMGEGFPHPRNYGAFARRIGRYVTERGTTDLETAVRSMTGLYAKVYPIGDRGTLRIGAPADIAVFDPARVRERSTYLDPHQLSEGVVHVLVNGEPAVTDGAFTGVRAGAFVARQ